MTKDAIINMVKRWDMICAKYRRRSGLINDMCNDCPLSISEEFTCTTAMHEETERFAEAWENATKKKKYN